ncbi:MAG: hypothetical protein KIT72_05600 [Polyangiaceae bacterium]|nr:hypothetical protein [Polyangiaceae bacterium]MCW5789874.1 hypothetical protein [Polyangiaceae bacterium]
MSLTIEDLRAMRPSELAELLARGYSIEASELEDTEYNGVSLGLPRLIERLTWTKFIKTFHRDPQSGKLRGWNVRVVQTPLSDPRWEPQLEKDGSPKSFGHYEVRELGDYQVPSALTRGLMIDYAPGASSLSPMSRLRDPIVALEPGHTELLLGWSYLDLGGARLKTPSYFALLRGGPLSHIAQP